MTELVRPEQRYARTRAVQDVSNWDLDFHSVVPAQAGTHPRLGGSSYLSPAWWEQLLESLSKSLPRACRRAVLR